MRDGETYRTVRRNKAKRALHDVRREMDPDLRATLGRYRFADCWPAFRLEKGKWK